MYINDGILKFADDIKIYAIFCGRYYNAIESLRRMYEWSNDWVMLFNIDKIVKFCTLVLTMLNMIICWVIRF